MTIDTTHKVIMLDNSAMEQITICPRLAYFSLVRRRKRARPEPALRFGGHIHTALAYRYRCEGRGMMWNEDTQMRILDRLFVNTPCEEEGWRNLEMAQKVIAAYNEYYALAVTKVVTFSPSNRPANIPLVERSFSFPLIQHDGWQVYYMGRIDCAYTEANNLYVRDHKTSSMMGPTYWIDAEMSAQQRGYCYAIKHLLGIEPMGYEMNVLVTRMPTRTGTSIDFVRQRFFVKGQLEEWYANTQEIAKIFLHYLTTDIYPQHRKHCVHKYGICSFQSICVAPTTQQETILTSSEYEDNTWTPLYK